LPDELFAIAGTASLFPFALPVAAPAFFFFFVVSLALARVAFFLRSNAFDGTLGMATEYAIAKHGHGQQPNGHSGHG
jgi:hypothetical protein